MMKEKVSKQIEKKQEKANCLKKEEEENVSKKEKKKEEEKVSQKKKEKKEKEKCLKKRKSVSPSASGVLAPLLVSQPLSDLLRRHFNHFQVNF